MHVDITFIIGIIATISGLIVGWYGLVRTRKEDHTRSTVVSAKLEYKVDSMVEDLKEIKIHVKSLAESGTTFDKELALLNQRVEKLESKRKGE